jgi:hypothetical protein
MKFFGMLCFAVMTAAGWAQTGASSAAPQVAQPEVSFQFERPGLSVPKFTLLVREDGTGRRSEWWDVAACVRRSADRPHN